MDRVFTKPRVCMHVCLSVCESIINIMQLCVRSFGWFCALQFHTVRTRHGRLCRPNRLLRLWLCITYTAGYLGDAELMSERRRSRNCITYWVFTRSDRRTDRSVRLVCPTIVSCKRFVRPSDRRSKNKTCLISSDCRSDCRSVWTLRPTGRTNWAVGRPITLQRRQYYN